MALVGRFDAATVSAAGAAVCACAALADGAALAARQRTPLRPLVALVGRCAEAVDGALRGSPPGRGAALSAALCACLAAGPPALALASWQPMALAGAGAVPALHALARAARRRRQREADTEAGNLATALADSLAAGHALRAALGHAQASVTGALRSELASAVALIERGASTEAALVALRERCRSQRVATIVAACLVQHRVGGNLPALLRECARAFAEHDQLVGEALAATAQARFSAAVVAALPLAGVALTELISPGYFTGLIGNPITGPLLALSALLQLGAFFAIRAIARAAQR